jgi:hypothetical protein
VGFAESTAPLAELSQLYRSAFADAIGV